MISIIVEMQQSAVFYYTSRIQDDNSDVVILPRCFDLHTDCPRWKREGMI